MRGTFLESVDDAEIEDQLEPDDIDVPADLESKVEAALKSDPTQSWDEAIWTIAETEHDSEDS